MHTLSQEISSHVEKALSIETPDPRVVFQALSLIDHTSLTGTETKDSVEQLCQSTLIGPHPAGICLYSNMVPYAAPLLQNTDIAKVAVVNFPHGKNDADEIYAEVRRAIENGATEIDTVIDYELLKQNKQYSSRTIKEKIAGAKNACGDVPLKVILEVNALDTVDDLERAIICSLDAGANFLKTSTGKLPKENYGKLIETVSLLEIAAFMTSEAHTYKKSHPNAPYCGIKISGGMRSPMDAAQHIAVWQSVMKTSDFPTPQQLRFGASPTFRESLLAYVENPVSQGVQNRSPELNAY